MYWAKVCAYGDELPDTKELWDTLYQYFERKTVSNKIYTLMQLYGLRIKTGAKIQDHLCKLDVLSDQLAAIGEEVSEVHKVVVICKNINFCFLKCINSHNSLSDRLHCKQANL